MAPVPSALNFVAGVTDTSVNRSEPLVLTVGRCLLGQPDGRQFEQRDISKRCLIFVLADRAMAEKPDDGLSHRRELVGTARALATVLICFHLPSLW